MMTTKKRPLGPSQCRGFTLIELSIVTGVIALLGALALPAYRNFVESARLAEVLAVYDAMREDVAILSQSTGRDPCSWPPYSKGSPEADFIRNKINVRLIPMIRNRLFNSVLTTFMEQNSSGNPATAAPPLLVQFGGFGDAQIARTRLLAEEFKRVGKFNRWEREAKTYVAFSVYLGNCAQTK